MIDSSRYFTGGAWLHAADVKNGAKLKIERFDEVSVVEDGTPKIVPILRFVDADDPMSLNKTNLNRLVELFGPDEKRWKGKTVTLIHVMAPNPKQGGKEVKSLRIK